MSDTWGRQGDGFSDYLIALEKLNKLNRSGAPISSPSKGGGGSGGGSSPSSSRSSRNDVAEEPAQEAEEKPLNTGVEPYEEEDQAQLVSLSDAVFIEPDSAKIGRTTPVRAKVKYLTDRTPQTMQVRLKATFEGAESFGAFQEAQVADGQISAELELIQHMDFYHKKDKSSEDKVSYTFIVKCEADGTEIESEAIELPKQFLAIDLIEVLDNAFNLNSIVPCLQEDGGLTTSIAALFRHLDSFPDKEVLVYGHTDTSGEHDYNLGLSEKRAKMIKAIIHKDIDLWKETIGDGYSVEDYQTTLSNLSTLQGWPCDPGVVDGKDGEQTKKGIKGFQSTYNTEYKGDLSTDGAIGPMTWGAICHTLYEIAVNDSGFTPGDIQVNFVTSFDGIYPCGENFPLDQIGVDGLRSATNRRVEIQCSDRPNPPQNAQPQPKMTIAEVIVYDKDMCEMNVITLSSVQADTIQVELLTTNEFPITKVTTTITLADGSEHSAISDHRGVARFTKLPDGSEGEITYDNEELLNKSHVADFHGSTTSVNKDLVIRLLQSSMDFELIKGLYQEIHESDLGNSIQEAFKEEMDEQLNTLLEKSGLAQAEFA